MVERRMPTEESRDLIDLVRDMAATELSPKVEDYEQESRFPREVLATLGKAGLLSLPFTEEYGGGGQPYVVYLQTLEELASAWLSVGIGVSVHTLSCFALAEYGTTEQKERWLADMLGGDLLGAYCLSEPQSGSDAAALVTRADRDGDAYVVNGTKSWITHGGVADFYSTMVRTSDDGARGITCLLVPSDTAGVSAPTAEHKMGANASRTAAVIFENARVDADRRIGGEGEGFRIALSALDAGRLGIAACSVGLAQAALECATAYAKERRQFGQPIADFQGIQFMLADMATGVSAARALYLEAAARKDAGLDFGIQAAMAKLFASDMAMRVTTDAVQVLGGAGYVTDFPAERYFREAKVLQIVEGTNQIQRMVIGRSLSRG
jgi:hypothetical protein